MESNFDSKALNEIGFRRDRVWSLAVEEFEAGWERADAHELSGKAEGSVQDETEQDILGQLESALRALDGELSDDEVLVVESEQGKDYPKTRHRTRNVVIEGENRLHFEAWIEPPLRVARFRRR